MFPYDEIAITVTAAWMTVPAWGPRMFNFFSSRPSLTPVEKWSLHNAKKATPDDLIAGAIVSSFAKDFKCWKFEGEFHQRHNSGGHNKTTLTFRKVTKKNVDIVFVFKQTTSNDGYSTVYKYKVIGCEVNGVRMTEAAFRYIYTNYQNIVVQVRRAEQVAAEAKAAMEANEKKWDLAEGLLGMKRDGFGRLMPVTTVEGEA
jgi:hypothetical protein